MFTSSLGNLPKNQPAREIRPISLSCVYFSGAGASCSIFVGNVPYDARALAFAFGPVCGFFGWCSCLRRPEAVFPTRFHQEGCQDSWAGWGAFRIAPISPTRSAGEPWDMLDIGPGLGQPARSAKARIRSTKPSSSYFVLIFRSTTPAQNGLRLFLTLLGVCVCVFFFSKGAHKRKTAK